MKILLLGELSGIHKELKKGLVRRGHTVVNAHSGDTYRKFESDIQLYVGRRSVRYPYLEYAKEICLQIGALPKLVGFDVVQVISPKIFHWRVQPYLAPLLLQGNKASVMINTGCSSDYNEFARTLAYSPCADCKKHDLAQRGCVFERADERRVEHRMYSAVDAIVSTAFEYHSALQSGHFGQKSRAIPLPVDTKAFDFAPLDISGKIVVYYGETRYGFKGSSTIRPALDRLQQDYPDRVEVIYTNRLNFSEYLDVLSKAHIVVDQSNSYSEGMNALYAMAMGKVVLSGAEPEARAFTRSPGGGSALINIRPNSEMIHAVLKDLVQHPQQIVERGFRSRDYVVRHHDTDVISEHYERLYLSLLQPALAKAAP